MRKKRIVSGAYCLLLLPLCLLLSAGSGFAQGGFYRGLPQQTQQEIDRPPAVRNVMIEQRLNEQIPLDLVFRDETGREAPLGEIFAKGRPVVLAFVYYECPMLCNQVLNGLVSGLKVLSLNVGRDFDVLAVSFDSREGAASAAKKKAEYLDRYKREGTAEGWHFLTGSEDSIKRLTEAAGFRYAWDEKTNQFAHASGVMVATPEGRLARYLYGIEYAPKDLRLGLVEASQNKIGTPVDQLLLYCYHYDPATGKYGAVVMNFLKLLSVIFLVSVAALFWIMRRMVQRQQARMRELGGVA